MNILPSITTSHKEITELQVKELQNSTENTYGLFITGILDQKERMDFLKSLPVGLQCPLVHVRIDSLPEELEYCLDHYNTKFFLLFFNLTYFNPGKSELPEIRKEVEECFKNYPVSVNHISAVRKDRKWYSEHIGNHNSDFNYLLQIPNYLFGEYSFLELENTLRRQREIITYINELLRAQ